MSTSAVASPHYLSAEAGRHILELGGNAVDAAIAVVAAQGVVAPETCGVGGDLFALVHHPGDNGPSALNASGRAGSRADAGPLREAGASVIPRDHKLAPTIPGAVDGLVALSERFGRLDLGDCLGPATNLADEGFPVSNEQSRAFTILAEIYRRNPAVADFYPGGTPVSPGDTVRRRDLAETLRAIAEGGREAFYAGRAGEDIRAALDPYVTEEDLKRPQHEWVEPIGITLGEDMAWTVPPNSAGYLGPATLAVFERLDPPDDPDDPLWWHLLIESHRALAWERDRLVADPSSAPVGADDLLSPERIERAAGSVSPDRAGTWPTAPSKPSGTAYMCVTDREGISVSVINSNYNGTGSTLGAARSGFLLHDRGTGFSLEQGHPNELLPGRRPAHTLSPTLWTSGLETSWLLGTRGGHIQPQLIAQLGARAILHGMPLPAAQRAPRWALTEYGPGTNSSVSLEPGSGVAGPLRDLGHHVVELDSMSPGWGPMSIVRRTGGDVTAASDPRVDTATAIVLS